MNEISLDDKILIGILRRKMKAGYTTASLVMMVSGLCEILERGMKK